MKCSKCNKNEATVFYREVINGKETKYNLCPQCAAKTEKEMNKNMFSSFYEPFETSILGSLFTPQHLRAGKREEKKCTLCGATFRELCEGGKAGCPTCYTVFREEFTPTLSRLHGGRSHRGRAPGEFKEKRSRELKAAELEKELKTAIAEERYEDAAVIRDKLKEL